MLSVQDNGSCRVDWGQVNRNWSGHVEKLQLWPRTTTELALGLPLGMTGDPAGLVGVALQGGWMGAVHAMLAADTPWAAAAVAGLEAFLTTSARLEACLTNGLMGALLHASKQQPGLGVLPTLHQALRAATPRQIGELGELGAGRALGALVRGSGSPESLLAAQALLRICEVRPEDTADALQSGLLPRLSGAPQASP